MKKLLAALTLAFALTLPTHEAHASCSALTLQHNAEAFFHDYYAYYGIYLYFQEASCNIVDAWQNGQPVYWELRSASCSSANSRDFQVWIHPTNWQYSGSHFICDCSGACSWQ